MNTVCPPPACPAPPFTLHTHCTMSAANLSSSCTFICLLPRPSPAAPLKVAAHHQRQKCFVCHARALKSARKQSCHAPLATECLPSSLWPLDAPPSTSPLTIPCLLPLYALALPSLLPLPPIYFSSSPASYYLLPCQALFSILAQLSRQLRQPHCPGQNFYLTFRFPPSISFRFVSFRSSAFILTDSPPSCRDR